MSTFSIFLVLIVIVAFLLVVVIMVQNPKGGGLSSSFGGGGNQQIGGVQKTTNFLDKSTWTLATILLVLILLANVSIMDGNTATQESRIMKENTVPVPTKTITPPAAPNTSTPAAEPESK
ncbi:preprotein translocase subunit SecG [Mesonia hippocampi]|uniref:Protein-export membrane protein SecG n=1 Tax=Mesonia hippocampi TaxID=1628250 RepID=A0A840EXF4_9FLAO|nr:preprotein translocase subunit SecG [Mesonia hippocampi]MBB4118744.1 preprotein translocase subunit SecG [Mesonia hippocampi]